jgi:hypothetical protein
MKGISHGVLLTTCPAEHWYNGTLVIYTTLYRGYLVLVVVMAPSHIPGSHCACNRGVMLQRCIKCCHVLPKLVCCLCLAWPSVVVAAGGWASLPAYTTSLA